MPATVCIAMRGRHSDTRELSVDGAPAETADRAYGQRPECPADRRPARQPAMSDGLHEKAQRPIGGEPPESGVTLSGGPCRVGRRAPSGTAGRHGLQARAVLLGNFGDRKKRGLKTVESASSSFAMNRAG